MTLEEGQHERDESYSTGRETREGNWGEQEEAISPPIE
jgi:hypothetical protein